MEMLSIGIIGMTAGGEVRLTRSRKMYKMAARYCLYLEASFQKAFPSYLTRVASLLNTYWIVFVGLFFRPLLHTT